MRHKLLDKELVNYCGNIYWVVFEIEQLSLKPLNSSKIVIVAKKKKIRFNISNSGAENDF